MEFQPCDICLEKKCLMPDGPGSCRCETCAKRDVCPRQLKLTVRITTKCTQECAHCCFECGPKRSDHMNPETAGNVARFARANGVRRLNVMGGEFFCNPDWESVLDSLCGSVESVRLVTAGDWAGSRRLRKRVIDFLAAHGNAYVALSLDKWHTNRHVDAAREACEKADVICIVPTKEEAESPPVPIGRHELFGTDSFYAMLSCYCQSPDRKYSFLIDEEGLVSKCPLGIWTYDRIGRYLDGGFRERFKQFHGVFRDAFVSCCNSCIRQWWSAKGKMLEAARE